jgi:biotin synthase
MNLKKIEKIRVSIGSATKMGLKNIKMDAEPTNLHLLTYNSGGCRANCAFCPQSQFTAAKLKYLPDSQEFLSRVTWPAFEFKEILNIIRQRFSKFSLDPSGFQRICLQTLNFLSFEEDVYTILHDLKQITSIPISIAIPPVNIDWIQKYKEIGVERICFALDTATESLFTAIKGQGNQGPYKWSQHIELLREAVKLFGRGYVSTHLIIGCGETEFEALNLIDQMNLDGIRTGLFAFTPIKNTKMEEYNSPSMKTFRKIQLGKYLLDSRKRELKDFIFGSNGELQRFNLNIEELQDLIDLSIPFQTSGCPGCNRPYYDSKPNEEQYSFPRKLTYQEKERVLSELSNFI